MQIPETALFMRAVMRAGLALAVAVVAAPVPALAQTVYEALVADPAVLHHYPGPDGLIGTGDDVVDAAPTVVIGSDPNFIATYSLAAARSPAANSDPAIPTGFDTISFLHGTVTVDDTVAQAGGGSLFQALDLTITQPVQGQPVAGGATTVAIDSVNGGAYNPATGAVDVDVSLEIVVPVFPVAVPITAMQASGSAFVVDSADFGAPGTGNTYVDNTLAPVAAALGADSLLFVDVAGTEPITGVAYRIVFAGVAGVPASNRADLNITKARAGGGPLTPGVVEELVVTVANAGPGDASGVEVVDPFPAGMGWVSDDCGAGPPDGAGVWRWAVGALVSGSQVGCSVMVEIAAGTVFDRRNGAVAFAAEFDPAVDDNIAFASLEVAAMVDNGLDQAVEPAPPTLLPSDSDCDNCNGGAQALADNFRMFADGRLQRIEFSGLYFDPVAGTSAAFSDQFTVQIFESLNSSGGPAVGPVPGALVSTISAPVQREPTGTDIFGLPEFRYTIDTSLDLARGEYWITVFNDSSVAGGNMDWFWAIGTDDAQQRGRPGIAASTTAPPVGFWSPGADFEMAYTLSAGGALDPARPVPALSTVAIWLMILVLAAGLVWHVRGGRVSA